jgi:adenylate cyclase
MATAEPLRRAAALVFGDIAGTTRLIAERGDLVVASALRDFFERTGALAAQHRCLVIKFIGDGFIAAFAEAADVIPFVSALHRQSVQWPSWTGTGLAVRFSFHQGEVLLIETSYGKDVFGTAVNIVARLNALASPGQIVVSPAAFERLPAEQQARAGAAEVAQVREAGEMAIRRVDLAGS